MAVKYARGIACRASQKMFTVVWLAVAMIILYFLVQFCCNISRDRVCVRTGFYCEYGGDSDREMVVRAVYFDDRRRYSHHNVSVFLVEMRKTIVERNLTVGCTVGKYNTTNFTIFQLHLNDWLHSSRSYLTHDFVLLECYDLPPVDNGSVAFITYRTPSNPATINERTKSVKALSERPYHIPAPYEPPKDGRKYKFKLAVCVAVVYEHPPWLNEWLQYQKTIGVDHIHMIADNTFEEAGGFENEYLKQAIQEGFVSIDVWLRWLNDSQVWYHSQGLAYQDCVYRFHGQYEYMFMLDTDDFFIPAVLGEPKLPYYIEKYNCYDGTYEFEWIYFYPDCGMEGNVTQDGNITKLLVSNKSWKHLKKSLHYLPLLLDANVHTRGRKLASWTLRIPKEEAYVAHMRRGMKPKQGC